jgi:hypothetical protein
MHCLFLILFIPRLLDGPPIKKKSMDHSTETMSPMKEVYVPSVDNTMNLIHHQNSNDTEDLGASCSVGNVDALSDIDDDDKSQAKYNVSLLVHTCVNCVIINLYILLIP